MRLVGHVDSFILIHTDSTLRLYDVFLLRLRPNDSIAPVFLDEFGILYLPKGFQHTEMA